MSVSNTIFALTRRCAAAAGAGVALLIVVLGFGACANSERKPLGAIVEERTNGARTPVRSTLPQTTLPMPPLDAGARTKAAWTLADGRLTRLADYSGKIVILDFYATWCPPCRDEVPHLASLQTRFGAQGLQVIGLNVGGEEDRLKVPEFVEQLGINYELAQPTSEAVELFMRGETEIPQTLVFNRDGHLLRHFTGYNDTIRRELEQVIGDAIKEASDK